MKLVDADKARECFGGDGVTGAVMQRMFDSLPTIDAVPVVRCRDCKWFNHYTIILSHPASKDTKTALPNGRAVFVLVRAGT